MKIHDKDGLLVTNTSKFAFTDPSTKIRFESGETARVAYSDWLKSQPVMVLSDPEEAEAYRLAVAAEAKAKEQAAEEAQKAKELADADEAAKAKELADAQKAKDLVDAEKAKAAAATAKNGATK